MNEEKKDVLSKRPLRYPLCGGLQVLVVDGPIKAAIVEGLKEAIQSFTRTPKWAKIRTIQI